MRVLSQKDLIALKIAANWKIMLFRCTSPMNRNRRISFLKFGGGCGIFLRRRLGAWACPWLRTVRNATPKGSRVTITRADIIYNISMSYLGIYCGNTSHFFLALNNPLVFLLLGISFLRV
jgi:hypothetical protein